MNFIGIRGIPLLVISIIWSRSTKKFGVTSLIWSMNRIEEIYYKAMLDYLKAKIKTKY